MDRTTLGNSGIEVSAIGFGGMRIPRVDESEAMAALEKALELGITLFETGHGYGAGSSQKMIGRATEGVRDDVVLFNKANIGGVESCDEIRSQMDRALKDERTDHFDCFSLWGVNNHEIFEGARKSGFFDELRRMREEGLTRLVGITTHACAEDIISFLDTEDLDVVTLKYNLLTRRQEPAIAELGRRGVGCLVMNPLAGGMVANPGSEVRQIFEEAGVPPAVLGLRYHTSNPGVSCPIPGMQSAAEVAENVAAGTKAPLTDEEKRLVEAVQKALENLGEDFCTGCGYCMPCPEGVGIPSIFTLWNMQRGYGADTYTKLEYLKIREQRHWADYGGKSAEACIECGECEEKCPNSLPIREMLKKAHDDLS